MPNELQLESLVPLPYTGIDTREPEPATLILPPLSPASGVSGGTPVSWDREWDSAIVIVDFLGIDEGEVVMFRSVLATVAGYVTIAVTVFASLSGAYLVLGPGFVFREASSQVTIQ